MKTSTLARLAVAGNRTDLLRTVLTGLSAGLAVVALLCAATVISIRGWADRYTNALLVEPGLRPGVTMALVLVSFPVLALAGQCIRLGAPARDRRLAAIRLAGATPRETTLIALAETAVASALGSLLGLAAYLVARENVDRHRLPADVLPPVPAIVLILLAVPLLAALIGAVLMRRVIVTPLGVTRRLRDRGPRPWPGLLIVLGVLMFGLPALLVKWENRPGWLNRILDTVPAGRFWLYLLFGGGIVLAMAGVVLGTGWLSHTAGRLLRRHGRGPATLLAGQRMITDPWSGSRTMAALLAAVLAGAVALGFRAWFATEFRAYDLYNAAAGDTNGGGISAAAEPGFYFGAIRLVMIAVSASAAVAAAGVLVTLAESIVARRRTYAALTVAGVPRRTLSAAILWQTLTPLIPALLLALAAGDAMVRMFTADVTVGSDGAGGGEPYIHLTIPVPWAHLLLLGGGALVAVLLAAGAGLLVLRASTDLEELRVS